MLHDNNWKEEDCFLIFVLLCVSERDSKPPSERCRVHRGRSSDGDGTFHVRPSGHGHPHWREGITTTVQLWRYVTMSASVSLRSHILKRSLCCFLQIDIHIMTQPPSGEWVYFNTELTNSSGRVSYVIPESRRLGIGVYPVKMVVRCVESLLFHFKNLPVKLLFPQ